MTFSADSIFSGCWTKTWGKNQKSSLVGSNVTGLNRHVLVPHSARDA